ncbi:hypothetical protein E4T43_01081 [Aureobasidium subglaciale]|nr:hypothetical protein E4T43_01081 [Aureobasidium subglaciale]
MADTNEGPVFRASKRRKVFRKRRDDDEASDGDAATPNGAATAADGRQEQELGLDTKEVSVAARHVRPTGSRKGGVGFSSTRVGNESGTSSVFDTNAPPTPLNAVEHAQARFVAPTGHIASADDKHIKTDNLRMAYVDSKLARLTPSHEASTSSTSTHPTSTPAEPASASTAVTTTHDTVSSIPASHGHLDEVNIPKPSHPSTTTTTTRSQKRPRKPWHSRRTSADLARDALVDQILQESALHTYSSTPAPPPPAQDDGDADERMAEEFKRNFYAAAEERASRRGGNAAPLPPTFGANKLESIKGPKLGGSRSQRAAMHAAEKAKGAKK